MDVIEAKFNFVVAELRKYLKDKQNESYLDKVLYLLDKFPLVLAKIELTPEESKQISENKADAEYLLKNTLLNNFDKIVKYIIQTEGDEL